MKNKKIVFLHILSYLSVLILSLCVLTVLFGLTADDTEKMILEQYDDRLKALVTNFENQVEGWGGICYSIYNNTVFKSYVDAISPFGEFELVSLLRGYEGSVPMVSEVLIYNREENDVITAAGKLDAELYFTSEKIYTDSDKFMDTVMQSRKVLLTAWEKTDGEKMLIYVYPIRRMSPYRTKQDIYILLLIPEGELDGRIANITGNLNGRYEIYQRGDLLYEKNLFSNVSLVDHMETLHTLEYHSSTDLYRFVIQIYPTTLSVQLKRVQIIYTTALVCLIVMGVVISIAYGVWSSRPYKRAEEKLDNANDIIRQQALYALLGGMPADEERIAQAGLTGKERRYCVAVATQPDSHHRITDDMMALTRGMPDTPDCQFRVVEYGRIPGVVIVFELLPSATEAAVRFIEKLYGQMEANGITALICAGGIKADIAQLCNSFGEAAYLCYSNTGKGVLFHERSGKAGLDSFPSTELVLVSQSLQTGNESAALKAIDDLRIRIGGMQSSIASNYTYSRLLSMLFKQAQANEIQLSPEQMNALSNFLLSDTFWENVRETVGVLCKRAAANNESAMQDNADQILQYIADHCLHYELGLEQISEAFDISMNRVSILVKKATGCTFREHLIDIRMKFASELLRETDDEIQVISNKVGYTSVPHFIKTFKGIYNFTPAQYRKAERMEIEPTSRE